MHVQLLVVDLVMSVHNAVKEAMTVLLIKSVKIQVVLVCVETHLLFLPVNKLFLVVEEHVLQVKHV